MNNKAEEGQVLALWVEHRNLYPVWFTIAQWFQTPKADDRDGKTPLVLLDGGENTVVLREAQPAAASGSQ